MSFTVSHMFMHQRSLMAIFSIKIKLCESLIHTIHKLHKVSTHRNSRPLIGHFEGNIISQCFETVL